MRTPRTPPAVPTLPETSTLFDTVPAYLGLGSNLGDRMGHMQHAVDRLAAHPNITVRAVSGVYETAAHTLDPDEEQPPFLNAVVQVETTLSAEDLLAAVLRIEQAAGRDRAHGVRWAPRTLDIDVLVYGQETRQTDDLTLPHPRLAARRFVLRPLADVAPDLVVPPPFGRSVRTLLAQCPDPVVPRRTPHPLRHPPLTRPRMVPPAAPDASSPDAAPAQPSAHDPQAADPQVTDPRQAVELPPSINYITIEGVIGAGKTTLAKLLSEQFDAHLVLEQFEENPFLERFYDNRSRWAFQTQLAFLASRFRQQKTLGTRDLFHQVVISDYSFDKDRIFARQNLSGDEMQLYERLYTLMEPNTPTPDLTVYLQSTPERLLQNIEKRGRSYEQGMDPDYIEGLHHAYNQYFFHYTKSPLLIVNAARIDFVENEDELNELIRQIARVHHPGTTYVNPLTAPSNE